MDYDYNYCTYHIANGSHSLWSFELYRRIFPGPQESSSTSLSPSTSGITPASHSWSGNYQNHKRHIQTTLATGSRKKGKARFQPYKVKETWTHDFCVLSDQDQRKVPPASYKQELREAGLGQKTIVFKNKRGDFKYLQEELFSNYPRLENGGGFDLYRQGSGK